MLKSLQSRKRQLVRDAIFDAAIDLFAIKGFDETTVEEVAQAAGISRRSFFRYFESKDDLLAYSIVSSGIALNKEVAECPDGLSPLEVVRKTILSVAEQAETWPRVRQMIEIAERSPAARQANLSRLAEAQDSLAKAFAQHFKKTLKNDLEAHLLASLTFQIMVESTVSSFRGEKQSCSAVAKQALSYFSHLFRDMPGSTPTGKSASKDKKESASTGLRKSGSVKR